jgi:hypothetical protein
LVARVQNVSQDLLPFMRSPGAMHTLLELSRKMGCPTTAKEGATGAQLFRELITYERGKFYSAPPLGGS